jgi:acetylglutamate kinase
LLVTDVEGVLDKNEKLISEIGSNEAEKLINNQTIHGGMIGVTHQTWTGALACHYFI